MFQGHFPILPLLIFVPGLAANWANRPGQWASPLGIKLAHGLTHWGSGKPMGLNNNRLAAD